MFGAETGSRADGSGVHNLSTADGRDPDDGERSRAAAGLEKESDDGGIRGSSGGIGGSSSDEKIDSNDRQEGQSGAVQTSDAETAIQSILGPAATAGNHARKTLSDDGASSAVEEHKAVTETVESRSVVALPPQGRPPPPEPDIPFEFNRFLEQLRHKSADPVARYLKSFLHEFSRKQWTVPEQVRIVREFLSFITQKMAQCDIWRNVSNSEFDNATEGMEKLVMNRLYTQTFAPAVFSASQVNGYPIVPLPNSRQSRLHGGSLGDDLVKDNVLRQKIRIFQWVMEEHLDIPVGESTAGFMNLAKQEITKINNYRAPRDKIICILNCSKVIFGLLRHAGVDQSADHFVPVLIFMVLHSDAEFLISNIQYIQRFRNSEKMRGEAGYYLSSLAAAISFVETLDRSSLSITEEKFNKNVEEAVARLALEEHTIDSQMEGKTGSSASNPRELLSRGAIAISSIKKPLSSIGRIFGEVVNQTETEDGCSESRNLLIVEEPPSRPSSAEQRQARKLQQQDIEETKRALVDMFPKLDTEIVEAVTLAKDGRVGACIDVCLELSVGND